MKKLSFLLIALMSGCIAFAQVINDANAEVREVKSFHAISISNAFDVFMSQGNDEAVAVSASEVKYRDMIIVEVIDGVLQVNLKKGKWHKGNKKLTAYISFRNIDRLTVGGACDVYIDGTLKADKLKLDFSGASDLKAALLDVKTLEVDISGASDVNISGTAIQLTVDASGASAFRGEDLSTDYCNAKASGASDVRITVNKELSAKATGASDVKYKGNGVIKDLHTNGASGIRKI